MKYKVLPPTISRNETVALTGIKLRTICNLIADGTIPSTKIGKSRRIHTRALLDKYNLDADLALATLNAIAE